MKYLSAQRRSWSRRAANHHVQGNFVDADSQTYLPDDVIFLIISLLDEERGAHHAPWFYTKTVLQPTLSSICLSSKRWNEIASKLLYKDIFLGNARSLTKLSLTLLKRKHLRPHVRSVFFTRAYLGTGDEWRGFGDWWDLERIYAICPNISTWTAKALVPPYSRKPGVLHRLELRRHFTLRSKINTEYLTRLELQAFRCSIDVIFSPSLKLDALQDLTLKDFSSDFTGDEPLQWPDMPRLRRLALHKCYFKNDTITLPSPRAGGPGLRALEFVAGLYFCKNIWSEIRRVGAALELLTFAPARFTNSPKKELTKLRSCVILRITDICFANSSNFRIRPNKLPPRLVHLVTLSMSSGRHPDASSVQDCVTDLINSRRINKETCKYLKTIRVNTRLTTAVKEIQPLIAKDAESVGIQFTLHGQNSAVVDILSSIFQRISPVF